MKNTPPQTHKLAAYASLHLLHNRFLDCDADLSELKGQAHEFSPAETRELEKFNGSPFATTGEFKKYCALRQADIMEIPIVFHDARNTHPETPLSCDHCTKKDHPSGLGCDFCRASHNAFLNKGCSFAICFSGECSFKAPHYTPHYTPKDCLHAGWNQI